MESQATVITLLGQGAGRLARAAPVRVNTLVREASPGDALAHVLPRAGHIADRAVHHEVTARGRA
jgi:hypothetical protein